jgi:antitoxin component YwqK of YwqJK toxin-antitoxin module
MNKIILSFLFFLPLIGNAQKQTIYYDYSWKVCDLKLARFVAIIEKTDSGFFRNDFYLSKSSLQMQGLYKDSACKIKQGKFTYFYPNGNISSTGKYTNEKKEGLWLKYYYNGMMQDSTMYTADRRTGISMGWYENGFPSDSSNTDENGKSVEVRWFDNGQPSEAGIKINEKQSGKWQYFHKNGNLAALEVYDKNILQSRIYFDENGKELADTTNKDRFAMFKGGLKKWKNFLVDNLIFPANYNLVNTNVVTVVIAAMIDEEGNVIDPYVDTPFSTVFDEEALRVIKKSPKWLPSIDHNRRVRAYVRQPISFAQTSY